jgi:hypothetical protein
MIKPHQINRLTNFNIAVALMLCIGNANSEICTDDYLITNERKIPLLPDTPIEIEYTSEYLSLNRGGLKVIFIYIGIEKEKDYVIHRYSTTLIGDTYYFDLIVHTNGVIKWEQYYDNKRGQKRGFGGSCAAK